MNEDYEVFTPAEAVKYLREKRGIIFAVASLRNRRRHNQAQAHHVLSNTTLWTKAELDAIQPSKKTKRVKKSDVAAEASHAPLMMLMEFGQAQLLRGAA